MSKEKNLIRLCAKGHLVADLYQYIKKRLFIAFFAHLRLADTELAATRSHRQIEALALVFCGIQKTYPGCCGKGHFEVTLYPHLGEKKRILIIFGRRFWLTQLQSEHVRRIILKRLSSSYRTMKNLNPIM